MNSRSICSGGWPRLVGIEHPNLSQVEQKDFDEISRHKFPWTLILDREELEKYWSSAVLPTVDPPVATPINPKFQISEPSWAGFTSHGIFMPLIH